MKMPNKKKISQEHRGVTQSHCIYLICLFLYKNIYLLKKTEISQLLPPHWRWLLDVLK